MKRIAVVSSGVFLAVCALAFLFPDALFSALSNLSVVLALLITVFMLFLFVFALHAANGKLLASVTALGSVSLLAGLFLVAEHLKIVATNSPSDELNTFHYFAIDLFVLPVSDKVGQYWGITFEFPLVVGLAVAAVGIALLITGAFKGSTPKDRLGSEAPDAEEKRAQFTSGQWAQFLACVFTTGVSLLLIQWTIMGRLAVMADIGIFYSA